MGNNNTKDAYAQNYHANRLLFFNINRLFKFGNTLIL